MNLHQWFKSTHYRNNTRKYSLTPSYPYLLYLLAKRFVVLTFYYACKTSRFMNHIETGIEFPVYLIKFIFISILYKNS